MRLPVALLVLTGSPRRDGISPDHVRLLAELTEVPPILVHGDTMVVLDGVHRVEAAKLQGQREIAALLFEGDSDAAFLAAVQANVTHGLPLSLADRRAAAARILTYRPQWSDRAIAASAGISASTVRGIRHGLRTDHDLVTTARIGQDGIRRPIDAAAGRRRAADLIAEHPEASLRAIARSAGISVGTVRDVRQRLDRGESPIPQSRRGDAGPAALGRAEGAAPPSARETSAGGGAFRPPSTILENLKSDPSLRYSETGRSAIRWLSARFVDTSEWSQLAEALPAHCAYSVAEFAVACAQEWKQIAAELIGRTDVLESGPGPERVG